MLQVIGVGNSCFLNMYTFNVHVGYFVLNILTKLHLYVFFLNLTNKIIQYVIYRTHAKGHTCKI